MTTELAATRSWKRVEPIPIAVDVRAASRVVVRDAEPVRALRLLVELLPTTIDCAASSTIWARRFYTAADDGLSKKWNGNVWLNPPYGKDVIGLFAEKLVAESRRFDQAVVLVNNATDTAWFHRLASVASAVCFICGRVKFLDKSGNPANTPVQGQAVLYVGRSVEHFRSRFSQFGLVVIPVRDVLEAGTLYDLGHL